MSDWPDWRMKSTQGDDENLPLEEWDPFHTRNGDGDVTVTPGLVDVKELNFFQKVVAFAVGSVLVALIMSLSLAIFLVLCRLAYEGITWGWDGFDGWLW